MKILGDFFRENKKGYFISLGVLFLGGLVIMAKQETLNLTNTIFLIPFSLIGLFVLGFGMYLFLGGND